MRKLGEKVFFRYGIDDFDGNVSTDGDFSFFIAMSAPASYSIRSQYRFGQES